ncbi:MAG: hypothetical protein F6K58_09060 [Symploca sp. SIO2E9]|nr:hypothetical protein [Symploca sp. SIO2E9]
MLSSLAISFAGAEGNRKKRTVVARLRRRNDAEEHLRALRRLMPNVPFSLIFDPISDHAEVFIVIALRAGNS